jgi:hypothetical protein
MTLTDYVAHQRKHGFKWETPINPPINVRTGDIKIGLQHVITVRKPRMNKTEVEFSYVLEARKRAGEIDGWAFESVKLRLADGCWYLPDFMAWGKAFTFYEVKGAHIWDDAMVKFKVAREQIKWATFELHQKLNGQWTRIL